MVGAQIMGHSQLMQVWFWYLLGVWVQWRRSKLVFRDFLFKVITNLHWWSWAQDDFQFLPFPGGSHSFLGTTCIRIIWGIRNTCTLLGLLFTDSGSRGWDRMFWFSKRSGTCDGQSYEGGHWFPICTCTHIHESHSQMNWTGWRALNSVLLKSKGQI
jgi:hypothetical protein